MMSDCGKEDDGDLDDDIFKGDEEEDFKNDTFEEELYADLGERQEMHYNELKSLYDESQKKVKELSKENQVLKDQNIILRKNISSLYLTAKEEIQRKDAQLKNLQERETKRKQLYAQKLQNNQS